MGKHKITFKFNVIIIAIINFCCVLFYFAAEIQFVIILFRCAYMLEFKYPHLKRFMI